MIGNDGLLTVTNNLSASHVSLAINALYESRVEKSYNKHAISAILHAYYGLESILNYFAYEMFINEESDCYVSEENRDLPLKNMIKQWNLHFPCLDKIKYILSVHKYELPANLENKFIELNNLRNWLTHGFSYKTTYLLEQDDREKDSYRVIDMEDHINWKSKFPNTKFNPIESLDSSDAEKAVRIILEIMLLINKATKGGGFLVLIPGNNLKCKLVKNSKHIDEIINPKKDRLQN